MRQSLLSAWKFSFENKIPAVLQSSSSAPDGRLYDRFFNNMLPVDRLRVCNPTEVSQKVEQVRLDLCTLIIPLLIILLLLFCQRLKNSASRGASGGAAPRYSLAGSASSRDLSTHQPHQAAAAPQHTHVQPRSIPVESVLTASTSSSSSALQSHPALAPSVRESEPPLRLSLSLNRSKSGVINPAAGGEEDASGGAHGHSSRPSVGKSAPGEKRPTFKFTMS